MLGCRHHVIEWLADGAGLIGASREMDTDRGRVFLCLAVHLVLPLLEIGYIGAISAFDVFDSTCDQVLAIHIVDAARFVPFYARL